MAKLKGKKKTFEKLQSLITIKGNLDPNDSSSEYLVEDFMLELDSEEDTVKFSGISQSQSGFAKIEFESLDVKSDGNIVVQNIDKFNDVLKLFDADEVITVEDSGKILTVVGDNMDFEVKSTDPDNLRSKENIGAISIEVKDEQVEFMSSNLDIMTVVSSEDIQKIIDVGDVVDTEDYPMEVKDGKLVSTLGDSQTGKMTVESELIDSNDKEGGTVIMYGIGGIGKNLKGDIEFYMEDGGPVSFRKNTDEFEAVYCFAQVQGNEEE